MKCKRNEGIVKQLHYILITELAKLEFCPSTIKDPF